MLASMKPTNAMGAERCDSDPCNVLTFRIRLAQNIVRTLVSQLVFICSNSYERSIQAQRREWVAALRAVRARPQGVRGRLRGWGQVKIMIKKLWCAWCLYSRVSPFLLYRARQARAAARLAPQAALASKAPESLATQASRLHEAAMRIGAE